MNGSIHNRVVVVCAAAAVAAGVCAQERSEPAPNTDAPVAAAEPAPLEVPAPTQSDLEEMLAPIALYPDQLLANVLAAAMYPDEVRAAAEFAKSNPDAAVIESMDWEPPVRAVAIIPNVIKMMGEYPDWVAALGAAYANHPREVMATVQTLRTRARDNGALFSTAEQTVATQDGAIVIQPARADVVYVPQYNPAVIYVERYDPWVPGFLTFGCAWTGFWISDLDCDWYRHRVCWGRSWHRRHGCDVDVYAGVGDWRGRPRPGQEGSGWAPDAERVGPHRTGTMARFRPGASTATFARMGPEPSGLTLQSGIPNPPGTQATGPRQARFAPPSARQADSTGRPLKAPPSARVFGPEPGRPSAPSTQRSSFAPPVGNAVGKAVDTRTPAPSADPREGSPAVRTARFAPPASPTPIAGRSLSSPISAKPVTSMPRPQVTTPTKIPTTATITRAPVGTFAGPQRSSTRVPTAASPRSGGTPTSAGRPGPASPSRSGGRFNMGASGRRPGSGPVAGPQPRSTGSGSR